MEGHLYRGNGLGNVRYLEGRQVVLPARPGMSESEQPTDIDVFMFEYCNDL